MGDNENRKVYKAIAISKKQFFINTIINIPHSESSRKHTYHALPLLPK